jgi:hypothetical protein
MMPYMSEYFKSGGGFFSIDKCFKAFWKKTRIHQGCDSGCEGLPGQLELK